MLYITILNKLEYIDSKLQGIYQRGGTKQMQKENKNDKPISLATEIIRDLARQNLILKIAVGTLAVGLILAIIWRYNMDDILQKAVQIRREYNNKYREANKEQINKRQNEWRQKNKDKVKQYNKNYWIKKAQQLSNA